MFNPEIVLGPPGTGKTTRLIDEVNSYLKNGTEPHSIGYLAFTRKAADEAVTRSCERFSLTKRQLPHFRTLHSLAFKMLGLTKNEVLSKTSIQEFGAIMGLRITGSVSLDEGHVYGNLPGDRALFLCNMARMKCVSLEEQWRETPEDLTWFEVERVFDGLEKFKKERGLIDFTDMLDKFIAQDIMPKFKLLVVDEAQDLSQMQWRMVEVLDKHSERTIVAGDDDQAIFRWAGADVTHFVDMPGKTTILDQSYRVPSAIQKVADKVIGRVKHRREKKWKPRPGKGEILYHTVPDAIDMSNGSWLVLARNEYQLNDIELKCRREGFIYSRRNRKSVGERTLQTIRNWENLRSGGECIAAEARNILRFTKRKSDKFPKEGRFTLADLQKNWGAGPNKIWHEAFTNMPIVERVYLISALRRGESPGKEARIALNTIHGAKGGQADNVVLYLDMAKRTYGSLLSNPEDEHRVFYVGVTRTKETLHIITPQTKFFFSDI